MLYELTNKGQFERVAERPEVKMILEGKFNETELTNQDLFNLGKIILVPQIKEKMIKWGSFERVAEIIK